MNKFYLILILFSINVLVLVKSNVVLNVCDFERFSDGCEDTVGSYCNQTLNQCLCKNDFNVKIENFCLALKNYSESCHLTEQCLSTQMPNIGCFSEDKELDIKTFKLLLKTDNLFKIVGTCMCPSDHYLSADKDCVLKKQVNENCLSSQECISNHSYCDQLSKQCKCKPTFRYSFRKRRCVSQLIGESCSDNEHCMIHDPNAECRIGSCQCRPGFILSHSGRCLIVRMRGTSNHLLMMLVVVATAVVFALLSTAHRKWSSSDDLFDRSRNQIPMNSNWVTRRTFPTTHNMVFPNPTTPSNQTYPVSLSVPSLALIWPLRHQNETELNQIYLDDGPPSYDEAISQSLRLSVENNSLTLIANDINRVNGLDINNSNIISDNNRVIHTNSVDNDGINCNTGPTSAPTTQTNT